MRRWSLADAHAGPIDGTITGIDGDGGQVEQDTIAPLTFTQCGTTMRLEPVHLFLAVHKSLPKKRNSMPTEDQSAR